MNKGNEEMMLYNNVHFVFVGTYKSSSIRVC